MSTPPLPALAEKLDRLLDDRVHWYRTGVKKGTMALEAAAEKQAEVEAIRRQFRWLVDNAWWLKPVAEQRRREIDAAIGARITHVMVSVPVRKAAEPLSDEERAVLDAHPAVEALRETFPEATPSASQPIPQHPFAASGQIPAGEADAATEQDEEAA